MIVRYDPSTTDDPAGEPPPVLDASTPDEIVEQVLRALDPEFRRSYNPRARAWFASHHSSASTVNEVLRRYEKVLG